MKERILFALVLALAIFLGNCKKEEEVPVDQTAVEEAVPEAPKIGDMVLIPAGEFTMGSDKGPKINYAAPEHKVNLPAYQIDAYEVTWGQWIVFTTESNYETESNWRPLYAPGKEDFPAANITLDDAKAYAKWAGKRIPTEAEWEKAARGPEGFAYPWGNTWDWSKPNCSEAGRGNTVEVGEMKLDKSPYGVYDMMGNISEWTSDEFKPYKGSPIPGDINFTRGYYVVRGSSYAMYANKGDGMFTWTRQAYFPKSQFGFGFRCVKDVEAPKSTEIKPPVKYLALLLTDLNDLLSN